MTPSSERMRVYRFERPVAESLGPRTPRTRRTVPWKAIVGGAIVLIAVAGTVAVLGRPISGQIPPSTTIDGVDVSEMDVAEAKDVVRAHGVAVVERGLVFVAGGNRFAIDTAALKLRPNAQVAVAKAVGRPGFVDRVRGRLGLAEARDIPLTYLFNVKEYGKATLPVRQAVTIEPVSAQIGEAKQFVVAPSEDGQLPDVGAMRKAVRNLGASGPEIAVATKVVPPSITTEEATAAAEKARVFVTTRHTVTLKDDARIIPNAVIVRSAGFFSNGKAITFTVSRPSLRAYFTGLYGKRERRPRDATFTVSANGGARIIGGRNGRGVDVDALAKTWEADPSSRVVPITIGILEPDLTTEEARNLGVTEVVSTFFTPYSGGARVKNIQLAARLLDQTILMPKKTFSLNETLGERTVDRGFVEAPMIGEKNILKDSVGGGISQVATTMFNAAFFAGLKLVAHTPHSFWITRYPKGREATVSWGGPELIFENDWEAPIVMLMRTDESGIRVTFLSDKLGRRVEAIEGKPYAYKPARIIRQRDRSLPPGTIKVRQPLGSDGFWIKYGRKIFKDGKLQSRQTWTWRYAPENALVAFGPKPRPEPTPEPDPNAPPDDGTTTEGGGGDPNTSTVPVGGT